VPQWQQLDPAPRARGRRGQPQPAVVGDRGDPRDGGIDRRHHLVREGAGGHRAGGVDVDRRLPVHREPQPPPVGKIRGRVEGQLPGEDRRGRCRTVGAVRRIAEEPLSGIPRLVAHEGDPPAGAGVVGGEHQPACLQRGDGRLAERVVDGLDDFLHRRRLGAPEGQPRLLAVDGEEQEALAFEGHALAHIPVPAHLRGPGWQAAVGPRRLDPEEIGGDVRALRHREMHHAFFTQERGPEGQSGPVLTGRRLAQHSVDGRGDLGETEVDGSVGGQLHLHRLAVDPDLDGCPFLEIDALRQLDGRGEAHPRRLPAAHGPRGQSQRLEGVVGTRGPENDAARGAPGRRGEGRRSAVVGGEGEG